MNPQGQQNDDTRCPYGHDEQEWLGTEWAPCPACARGDRHCTHCNLTHPGTTTIDCMRTMRERLAKLEAFVDAANLGCEWGCSPRDLTATIGGVPVTCLNCQARELVRTR